MCIPFGYIPLNQTAESSSAHWISFSQYCETFYEAVVASYTPTGRLLYILPTLDSVRPFNFTNTGGCGVIVTHDGFNLHFPFD